MATWKADANTGNINVLFIFHMHCTDVFMFFLY